MNLRWTRTERGSLRLVDEAGKGLALVMKLKGARSAPWSASLSFSLKYRHFWTAAEAKAWSEAMVVEGRKA